MPPVELLKFAPVADPTAEIVVNRTDVIALHVYDGCGESAMVRLTVEDAARLAETLASCVRKLPA